MFNNNLPRFGDILKTEDSSLDEEVRKITHIQNSRGPWVRAAQLADLFCSWDLAYRCTKGGWLRPIVQGKRRTIYRLADVLTCMQRIEAGERPMPRRSKAEQ